MARPSKREHILSAAARLAEASEPISLDRIAAAAGVSKGGLLYHFPSRRDLLVALVASFVRSFEAEIEHPDDLEWGRRYLRATIGGAQLAASASLIVIAAEDPSLLDPLRARMAAWQARARAARPELPALRLAADGVWYARLIGLPAPDLDLEPALERLLDRC